MARLRRPNTARDCTHLPPPPFPETQIVLEVRKTKMLDQQLSHVHEALGTTRNLMGGINTAKEQSVSIQKVGAGPAGRWGLAWPCRQAGRQGGQAGAQAASAPASQSGPAHTQHAAPPSPSRHPLLLLEVREAGRACKPAPPTLAPPSLPHPRSASSCWRTGWSARTSSSTRA